MYYEAPYPVVVEVDDDERNAAPVMRRPMAMTRVPRPWPQPRPYPTAPVYQRPASRPVVIVQRQPSLLAGIDLGDVVEHGVTLLAALQSLPDAPTVTGDPSRDVGNMILFQEALGDHAKADERVRAFGNLVAQVVRVLTKNAQQRSGGYAVAGG